MILIYSCEIPHYIITCRELNDRGECFTVSDQSQRSALAASGLSQCPVFTSHVEYDVRCQGPMVQLDCKLLHR